VWGVKKERLEEEKHTPTTKNTITMDRLKAVCVGKLVREAKVKARLSLCELGLSLWELALSLRACPLCD
jgi:hypothetical protein